MQKQVIVFRLLHEGTVEEKVVERALNKLCLDTLLIRQGLHNTLTPASKGSEATARGDRGDTPQRLSSAKARPYIYLKLLV